MAAKQRKEVAQAYVRLYPIIDGLAKAIAAEITKAQSPIEEDGKQIGKKLAQGISKGLELFDASGLSKRLKSGVGDLGSFAANSFKRMGTVATSVLSKSFSASASVLSSSVGSAVRTGVGGAALVAGAGFGYALNKGLGRALSLTEAKAKMKGLGYQGEELNSIITSASTAMDGLAFSTGDAATAAAGLLASGIKPGEQLTKILRTIGDTASVTGAEYGEIGAIYGKIFASGNIQGEELAQLGDRGVPILQYLSKSLNITAKDVKKLASEGKISAEQFAKAMEENLGGVGEIMAKESFKLSAKNVGAAIGRVFEPAWTTVLESAIPVFGALRTKISGIAAFLKPVWIPFQDKTKAAFEKAQAFIEKFNVAEVFNRAKNAISELNGAMLPIVGLIAGMSGGLLSGIPIIGSLFSGITGPVGLLAGFFAQVVTASTKLQDSFGRLGTAVGDLFKKLFQFDGKSGGFGDVFKNIGDKLADGVDSVTRLISGKGDQAKSYFDKIWAGILAPQTLETLKKAGEKIFGGISGIFTGLVAIVTTVATDPRVRLAFAQIADALGAGFAALSKVTEGGNAASIGSSIASAVAILGSVLSVAISVISNIAGGIMAVVSSPAFAAFAEWLKGVAQLLVQNTAFLSGALITVGALFVGFKAFGFLKALGAIKIPDSKLGDKIGALLKGLAKGIGTGIRAIPGVMQAFMAATPAILGGIASFALILGEIAALGLLFELLHVGDGLKMFASTLNDAGTGLILILGTLVAGVVQIIAKSGPVLATALTSIFTAIKPILDWIVDVVFKAAGILGDILVRVLIPMMALVVQNIQNILQGAAAVLGGIADVITAVLTGIADVAGTIFNGLATVMLAFAFSTASVITSLNNGGLAAGAAALALAAGITALSVAMAGGTLMQGAANFGSSLANLGAGVMDSLNPANWGKQQEGTVSTSAVDQILQLVETLKGANGLVSALTINWTAVAIQASFVGNNIAANLANGIVNSSPMMSAALSGSISTMLSNAQAQLDAAPLQVRVAMPAELSAVNVGSTNYAGQTVQNITNKFDVSNPDPMVAARHIENLLT
jgi:tape measure domain-containing protein